MTKRDRLIVMVSLCITALITLAGFIFVPKGPTPPPEWNGWVERRVLGVGFLTDIKSHGSSTFALCYMGRDHHDDLYRTTNGGQTWMRTINGLKPSSVGDIAFGRDGRIFLSTGRGVYLTDNNGDYWTAVRDCYVGNICLDTDGALVARGTDDKTLCKSVDNGMHWKRIGNPWHTTCLPAALLPANGKTQCAVSNHVIYKTNDHWKTWKKVFTCEAIEGDEIAVSPNGRIAVLIDAEDGKYKLLVSGVEQKKWLNVGLPEYKSASLTYKSVAFAPNGRLLLGTSNGLYSLDESRPHWSDMKLEKRIFGIRTAIPADKLSVDNKGRIYVASYDCVFSKRPADSSRILKYSYLPEK